MISIKQLDQAYEGTQILWKVNLDFAPGECTCVMGRNGVGKTTLLKVIMGLLPATVGECTFESRDLLKLAAYKRAHLGIGYVPQGRDIFPQLTVEENLRIGLGARADRSQKIPDKIFELFPVLEEMRKRRGGDLSGGQQQQLAIGRALATDPKVLILDEPNEGIQPNIVQQIGDVLMRLKNEDNMTIILVEQKLAFARKVGDHFRLIERGRVVAQGTMPELRDDLIQQHLAV